MVSEMDALIMKKNILVLIETFGPGGAEKASAIVSQMIHESGKYNVYYCSIYNSNENYHLNEVERKSLNITRPKTLSRKVFNYWLKIRRLKKLKKELNIDLTISSLWPADWINILTGREKKIAVIQINILNNDQNKAMVKFRKFVTYVYNKFERVVLVSANLKEEMTSFFEINEEKIFVIHNPIDSRKLDENIDSPVHQKLKGAFEKYKILIAANRLHDIKNTISLVPILKSLNKRDCYKLVIAGSGEEEQNIKARIIEERLRYTDIDSFDETADVYFLGFQENVHSIISKSSLFLLPTKGEGFSLALLEAMYCKVPVMVSDCPNGGVSEIMKGESHYDIDSKRTIPEKCFGGFLMPIPSIKDDFTINQWARGIEELLESESIIHLGEENRKKAVEYDINNLKFKWFYLIDTVLEYEFK